MAEVHQALLRLRVGACLAVVHLRGALRAEHPGTVEGEGGLQVRGSRRGVVGHLDARVGVVRAVDVGVDLEAEHIQQAAGGVVVVLVLEGLVLFQQVVDVVGAEHQHAAVLGHLQVVEGALQGDDVLHGHLLAARRVRLAAGGDDGRLVRVAVGCQGVGGLLVLDGQDGVAVTLHVGGELVVGDGIQLVVRHAGGLRLELVQPDGDVRLVQVLDGDGIGGVVHQHVRVAAHVHQVYDLVLGLGRIVRDAVQEVGFQACVQAFDQFAGPHFGEHAFQCGSRGMEGTQCGRDDCARYRPVDGIRPDHGCQHNAHQDVEQHSANEIRHNRSLVF